MSGGVIESVNPNFLFFPAKTSSLILFLTELAHRQVQIGGFKDTGPNKRIQINGSNAKRPVQIDGAKKQVQIDGTK